MKVHIDQQFGVYTQLLTDDSDPDHPLEIAVIPPRPEHDYYTLVTVGLSRHRMGFPEERREEKLERAELLINLPRDWKLTKVDCREELWSWPIRMMLATAHFAMEDPEVGLESRTTLDEMCIRDSLYKLWCAAGIKLRIFIGVSHSKIGRASCRERV